MLPPPTTATGLPRKKKPSQVAQAETPWPANAFSLGRPSQRAWAPVARIRVSARISSPPSARHANGRLREVDLGDAVEHQLGAAVGRLRRHLLHQPGALDHLGEARIVLDVGRDRELAADLEALDQERLQIGARRVDRRGVAGRARSR